MGYYPEAWAFKVANYPHVPERRYASRRARLKAVFEGRCRQLEEARQGGLPYPKLPQPWQYGRAVTNYTRARTAWRRIRGWH